MFTISRGGTYTVAENQMRDFADSFLTFCKTEFTTDKSFFVCLKGDLGAGKTSFSKKIGEILEVKEQVTSPTFVIQKTYITKNDVFKKMIHIDTYRLDEEKELLQLGFLEQLLDKNTIILLEWPEKVPKIASNANVTLVFTVEDQNSRTITVI